MISLYSGTPGSGKSLHAAKTIYYRLWVNKPVIANFSIATDKVKSRKKGDFIYWDNMQLTPKKIIDYAIKYWGDRRIKEDTILLVIDEAQIIFNSRDWSKKDRGDWLSFFTQHRHFGIEIILIAQFDRMLDRQIRSLIEYEFIHRKVNNFGIGGFILGALTFGKLFVSVKVWYPIKEKVGSEFFKAHRKYYSLYDTYSTFALSHEDGV